MFFFSDEIVVSDDLKRQMVDVLSFSHPGSQKKLAKSDLIWWSGMRKDIDDKSNTYMDCFSSSKTSNFQLPSIERNYLPVLTEAGKQIKIDVSGKIDNRKATRWIVFS